MPSKLYSYYRLQTEFGKVMFLHLSVSHPVHQGDGCLPLVLGGGGLPHSGLTPPSRHHLAPPHGQAPPAQCMPGYTPLTAQCMLGYTPPAQCMLGYTTPPCPVHGIWSTSGRYASHWNTFLFMFSVPVYYCVHACVASTVVLCSFPNLHAVPYQ